jgi:phage regulator Rha-like protein
MGVLIPFEQVRERIVVVRGQRVMLSGDLAELYGVEHRALIQTVKRNRARFPADFMLRLKPFEWSRLRSQFVILDEETGKPRRGRHTKYPPLAFTEHGVAMLSSILRSRRAVEVNIQIVRVFVQLRQWVIGNRELARKVSELEKRYDGQLRIVFEALESLMQPPASLPRKRIGFEP